MYSLKAIDQSIDMQTMTNMTAIYDLLDIVGVLQHHDAISGTER